MGRLTILALLAAGSVLGSGAAAALDRGEMGDKTSPGTSGDDRIRGTKGKDRLIGGGGDDLLVGGRGTDLLLGGRGADVLRGGPGRDGFAMRRGVELPSPGRDRIEARDGKPDEINCGAGRDRAVVDSVEDGVVNCELVQEPQS